MRRNLWLAAVAIALGTVAAAGCDEDTPEDRCNGLFETLCRRKAACDTRVDYATCRQTYGPPVDCSAVCDTTGDYDACLDAIREDICAHLMHATNYDFPTVCENVLWTGCP
jgi:hypothetical protein